MVLEGPDGVGKSSLASGVVQALASRGVACELMSFPGGDAGTLGRLVYHIHHEPHRFNLIGMTAAANQSLHLAAHLDAIERRIAPTLQAGRHILLDRYWWSTWVYGISTGITRAVLKAMIDLERAQWGAIKPALAVLVWRDEPIDRGKEIDYWRRLRHEYELLAAREAAYYPVEIVPNNGTREEGVGRIISLLEAVGILTRSRREKGTGNGPLVGRAAQRVGQVRIGFGSAIGPVVGAEPGRLNASDERTTQPTRVSPPTDATQATLTPHVFASHLSPAKLTPVYDSYWRFAGERQRIFFRRLFGAPRPWTDDPVLGTYKFTNAYRASDRVSQYLIRHVIYRPDLPSSETEVCFRILLFKIFNRIETWELLETALGAVTYVEYDFQRYDAVLSDAMRAGRRIYSAAYIMPPGTQAFGHVAKHQNHLQLLERMMGDELPKRLVNAATMQQGFELLRNYPTVGDFLAYQFITDINYSELTHYSEMEFVVPGPGALDGIQKCFSNLGGLNEPELIRFVADLQETEFERLGLKFDTLWGRRLQLIDCQNLFCEISKYARVAHPDFTGVSGRTRIKQKYKPGGAAIDYWYPPKWNINHLIGAATVKSGLSPHRPTPGQSPTASTVT